jgi:hypothetical protein
MIACGGGDLPVAGLQDDVAALGDARHLAELVDRGARRLGLPRERPGIGQRVQVPAAPVHHAAGVERRFHQLGNAARSITSTGTRSVGRGSPPPPPAPPRRPGVFGEGRAGAVGGLGRVGRAEIAQLPARVFGKVPEGAGAGSPSFASSSCWDLLKPRFTCPPLRPDAPKPTRWASSTTTRAARARQRQRGPEPGEPRPEDRHIRGDIALQRRAFGVRRQARGIPGRGVFAGLVVAIERRHDAGSDVHQQVLALPGGDDLQELAVFQRFHRRVDAAELRPENASAMAVSAPKSSSARRGPWGCRRRRHRHRR